MPGGDRDRDERERGPRAGDHERQPAFGHYIGDGHAPIVRAVGVIVLTLDGNRISHLTRFGGSGLLSRFGLPRSLPL